MQKKQWQIKPADKSAPALAKELNVSPLMAQILINRGAGTAKIACEFLNPKLNDLLAPEKMPGAEKAVERIAKAIKNEEKITIYGDYDVDGITSVSILTGLFDLLGAKSDYYIPHRIDEGYGLNTEAIEKIAQKGTKLVITVDCGITAFNTAAQAARLGLDLIITDHHRPKGGNEYPEAVAIVHPQLEPDYPTPYSAGAMVAFKLAWAVVNKLKGPGKTSPQLREFLINATIFAAMGTIADVIDLRGENRIISSFGLRGITDSKLPGLAALIDVARLTNEKIDSYHIGYCLSPILNAAGRMGHARLAVELLTSDSQIKAMRIAEYLKEQNKQRQQIERKIFKQVCDMISKSGLDMPHRKSIVIGSGDWHTGVIGIVASRVIDKYYRPTILFNISDGKAQASARSIEGFDILEAIKACSENLLSYGGHAMAAGLTLKAENLDKFAQDFEEYACRNWQEDFTSNLEIDAVCSLGDLEIASAKAIANLGPFGKGNPEPVFVTKGVRLTAAPRKVGQHSDHLQITICDNSGSFRCIGFRMANLEKKLQENEFFNVAYKTKIDSYYGTENIQLILSDIQF
ncbi:MAG: single-stranded-DNA-specific exonuclease RecJ [Anaerohalosphaeraceae bacterium]|nr:single-stranded-DNA-specific exonuclease RecJ [Anaerohalosphaeraceae bacterium]